MNKQTSDFKTKILLVFILLLQIILIYTFVANWFRGDINTLLNSVYIYLPICIFITVSCLSTIVLLIKTLIQKDGKRSKKILRGIWLSCLVICLLTFAGFHYNSAVSKEEQTKFSENFSPQQVVSEVYKESSSAQIKCIARRWWQTEYFRSNLSENSEILKLTELDNQTKQEYPNISVLYDVTYVKNVSPFLQDHMSSALDRAFYMEFDKFSKRDRNKIEKFEQEGAEITLFRDSHIDLETERLLTVVHYNDAYILVSLIFQDSSGNLQIDSNQILDYIVDVMKP